MMQPLFECEVMRRSSRNAQIILAIPLGLTGGYLLINLINGASHQRLFAQDFLIPAFLLFFLGIIAEILIWYYSRGKLFISRGSDNNLQIEIDFSSGKAELARGEWSSQGIYTKEYEKFGMYKKHLALNLSCDGRSFCLLRHDLAPIKPEPRHFTLVSELYNLGGTEYWCKKTEEVHAILEKESSFKN